MKEDESSLLVYLLINVQSHLILGCSELLGVGEIVHGNGEEHVEQGVVTKQGQHDEVQRVDHTRPSEKQFFIII